MNVCMCVLHVRIYIVYACMCVYMNVYMYRYIRRHFSMDRCMYECTGIDIGM